MISDDDLQPSVYVQKMDLVFENPIREDELKARTDRFLSGLTDALKHAGCELIGHIKGAIATEEGYLVFSVTSFEEGVRFKGGIPGEIFEVQNTINIIVYGVEPDTVGKLFHREWERHWAAGSS
jgi:hypothetical protein